MICYVLAMGKLHLGPQVVVGYGIKMFWPGLFITSPDHLEVIEVHSLGDSTSRFVSRDSFRVKWRRTWTATSFEREDVFLEELVFLPWGRHWPHKSCRNTTRYRISSSFERCSIRSLNQRMQLTNLSSRGDRKLTSLVSTNCMDPIFRQRQFLSFGQLLSLLSISSCLLVSLFSFLSLSLTVWLVCLSAGLTFYLSV